MLCSQSFCLCLLLFTSLQVLSYVFSQTFLTSFCLRSVQCSSLNLECSSPRSHSLLLAPSSSSRWGLLWVVVVQSSSYVQLFVTLWTAVHQASQSLIIFWGLPKFMSIASVMPSNHLIPWCPLLLLPSIFASIRDFSNELAVPIRWPKYWSFSLSISLSKEYLGLILSTYVKSQILPLPWFWHLLSPLLCSILPAKVWHSLHVSYIYSKSFFHALEHRLIN